jgi:glycosyltransferase involved in cell wall biosynthesis
LKQEGFNISLIIRGKKNDKNKVNLKEISRIPDLDFPVSLLSYFVGFIYLFVSALKKPAVFYVRDTGTNIAVLLGKAFGIPTVLEINGDLENEYSNMPRPLYFLIRLLIRISYSSADYVIVPSQKLLRFMEAKRKLPRVFLVPNGVNPCKFFPMSKSECRKKLKLSEALYFCFVGHLAPWQGVENSLLAFSKLLACYPNLDARYLIVGTGPFLEKLQALTIDLGLSESVRFLGSVSHDQVPYIIGASDICVAPFKSQRNEKIGISPLKIYEYLSCGRPVITSRLPGLEIVSNLNAGIMATPDCVDDLVSAYKEMLQNFSFFEQKALSASAVIASKHSWSSRVHDITKIIGHMT